MRTATKTETIENGLFNVAPCADRTSDLPNLIADFAVTAQE
jgi:hypothetical protein